MPPPELWIISLPAFFTATIFYEKWLLWQNPKMTAFPRRSKAEVWRTPRGGGGIGELPMSGLGRLFGKGKKEKGPTPEEAIQKLKETEKVLIKKQEFLEQKIQQELQTAKKYGTKNKRAALQALRRKKRFEQQLAQTDGTLSTLEFQREAIENATTNAEVLRTMELAAQGMKKAYQDMDIDKVDELMTDIIEQQEVAQQISDAISRPMGFGDDVDEDELLEELELLEQEELAQELLSVGDKEEEPPVKLPGVPSTHLPAEPAPKADEDEEALKQLAEWVS
uniref:Charged multivesicular body protein 4A n=1 Tax=Macaca mulatta TaxID=9544 RepID=A0A5F8A6J7_MACMU